MAEAGQDARLFSKAFQPPPEGVLVLVACSGDDPMVLAAYGALDRKVLLDSHLTATALIDRKVRDAEAASPEYPPHAVEREPMASRQYAVVARHGPMVLPALTQWWRCDGGWAHRPPGLRARRVGCRQEADPIRLVRGSVPVLEVVLAEPAGEGPYLKRLGFDTADDPQPDPEDDLRNRDVLVEVGGDLRATLYGVLAFGKDPQRYARTRDFRIECVAYAGDDRAAEVLQVADAAGRLDEQVERATGWFLGLGRFESYEKLVRQDRHLLPRRAIREALANAVTHRDYAITGAKVLLEVFDRRVDVSSPGTLPNHMTVERVRAGANPRSRNESLAHYMAGMGFMERRGRGWLIMRREMLAFNGTEPELLHDEPNRFVRVTFRLAAAGGG